MRRALGLSLVLAAATLSVNAYSIGAGYLYNFSKRTLVYVQGAWGKANKALNLAPGLSGWNTSLGVMHRF